MFDEVVEIQENKKVNSEYFKLIFSSKKLAAGTLPGQFVNVQIENHEGLLLRRPFSYYRVKGSRIELLYEILGKGTALLAEKRRGQALKVLGPLGRAFTQEIGKKKRVLVGGGVGVPPLLFLAERARKGAEKLHFLIGCKTKDEVLPKKELSGVRGTVCYATNDGSYGKKGFVTILLEALIKREDPRSLFIQTCGPHAMMMEVMKLAGRYGIEGEASIDERMACGVGACLGCVVETRSGFKTSCVEGPVFPFKDLIVHA